MNENKLLPSGIVVKATGVAQRALSRWIVDGVIKPTIESHSKGGRQMFSHADMLRVGVVKKLRQGGASLKECRAVMGRISDDDLWTATISANGSYRNAITINVADIFREIGPLNSMESAKPQQPQQSPRLYYLQNVGQGFCGNSPYWYRSGGSGYTIRLDDAAKFTGPECTCIIRSTRGSHRWRRWPVSKIDKLSHRTIDAQDMTK